MTTEFIHIYRFFPILEKKGKKKSLCHWQGIDLPIFSHITVVGRLLNQLLCLTSNCGETSESFSLFFEFSVCIVIQTVDFNMYMLANILAIMEKWQILWRNLNKNI